MLTARRSLLVGMALATAAAALLVLRLAPASGHYPPPPQRICGADDPSVTARGPWRVIRKPDALTEIDAHAAGLEDGTLVLAADRHTVVRSTDGGCTWREVYSASGGPQTGTALPRVGAVAIPGGAERQFVVVDGIGAAAGSRLLAAGNATSAFGDSGAGLPDLGRFGAPIAAPSDHEVLYLPVSINDAVGESDGGTGISGSLYASHDAGRQWDRRSGGVQIVSLAVDPLDARSLWAVRADHTVQRSTDGGASWKDVAIPAAPWRLVAVAHRGGKPATVAFVAASSADANVARILASLDGGATFAQITTEGLGPVAGIAFGNTAGQLVVASGSDSTAFHGPGAFYYDDARSGWIDADEPQLHNLRDPERVALTSSTRGHAGYAALQMRRREPGKADVLARFEPPDPINGDLHPVPPLPCLNEPPLQRPVDRKEGEHVAFQPDTLLVDLEPGVAKRQPLEIDLDKVPTPLDVNFVIDSSDSMDPAIAGVTCSLRRLARALVDRGTDVWFGVSTFRGVGERYTRLIDVSPPGPRLTDALRRIYTRKGEQETLRSALFQSATGAGLTIAGRQDIAPGQQANFRADALHIDLVIGDEPYDGATPDEPAREAVVKALRDKDIKAVGVQVIPPEFDAGTDPSRLPTQQAVMRQQLRYFASGSGAVAPRGGVDCDGNGTVDINAGQPIVCGADETGIEKGMGDTLIQILGTVQDIHDVEIRPRPSKVSVGVENAVASGLDLTGRNELSPTAVVSCTPRQAGKAYPIAFDVLVGSRVIGTLKGTAACGAIAAAPAAPRRRTPPRQPPAPVAPTAPPAAAQPQPAIVAAPPPPPPAPVPVASAAPAQAPAAASSPTAAAAPAPGQPGVAAAPQRAARIQVATVDTADGTTHQFSAWQPRRHRRNEVPIGAIITLGAGACGAFGWAAFSAGRRTRGPALAREELWR